MPFHVQVFPATKDRRCSANRIAVPEPTASSSWTLHLPCAHDLQLHWSEQSFVDEPPRKVCMTDPPYFKLAPGRQQKKS